MAITDYDRSKEASAIKIRIVISAMVVLLPVVCYISRQNISIAITAMVKESDTGNRFVGKIINGTAIQEVKQEFCPTFEDVYSVKVTYGPKYDWTNQEKDFIQAAFFYLYVVCQIPAGRLAEIFGPTYIFQLATIVSALVSFLTPLAAKTSPWLFALLRAILGVAQAAIYPACYVLYSHWLPPKERSIAIPMIMAGAFIGSIIASSGTGILIEHKSFGWEYSFYFAGITCALWAILWYLLGSDEPRQNKFISLEEIQYIESQLEVRSVLSNGEPVKKKQVSWYKILTSKVLWIMYASFFASDWAFSFTIFYLPSYLNDVLNVSPSKNGFINSIMYLLFIITAPLYGFFSSYMIERRVFGWSCCTYRKIFQSIALFSQTICYLLVVQFGCDIKLILATLYIQVILYSFNNVGEVLIPSDLSPHFSGVIYAIANTIGSSTGFIIPLVMKLVENRKSKTDWEIFFYISSTITLVGGLIFGIFGRNDYQDFSKDDDQDENWPEKRVDVFHKSYGNDSIDLKIKSNNTKTKDNCEEVRQISI